MLEAFAQRYAGEHGLRFGAFEWVKHGDQWLLRPIDAEHTVRVVFPPDEIEMFADDRPESGRLKTRFGLRLPVCRCENVFQLSFVF